MILIGFAAVSAIVHLYAEYRGPRWLVYLAKPLTTSLLIAAAVLAPRTPYSLAVVVGLLFSLAGDVFLMLPRDHFLAGLVSFLLAHLAYVWAFSRDVGLFARPLLAVPYVLAAGVILAYLWPRLGALRLPVVVYVGALVVMAWQAAARGNAFATIGAALFVVSDATLAIDRFRRPFRAAQLVVMSTYVAAQALIAVSTYG